MRRTKFPCCFKRCAVLGSRLGSSNAVRGVSRTPFFEKSREKRKEKKDPEDRQIRIKINFTNHTQREA